MNKKVLLGMSGGVDSSVCAILLQKQGYEVIGATMQLWESENIHDEGCGSLNSIKDAKKVCEKLGIEHYTFKFIEEFKTHVIDNFVQCYLKGITPNPCIECNKFLKFDLLYKKAQELGCEYISTGHYAKTVYSEEFKRYVIKKSNAGKKDQTYVLYNINKELVSKILFPLGQFETKEQIRQIAKEHGLDVASKPDSQEICFIPDDDYVRFLKQNSSIPIQAGDIVYKTGEIVGKHNGLVNYTIGQRKGMGIAHPTPLYVISLDVEKNQVIVGEESDLYSSTLYANELNLLIDNIHENLKVDVKIRYSHVGSEAIVNIDKGIAKIDFITPQKSITPGQSAVLYIGDVLIGGGKII